MKKLYLEWLNCWCSVLFRCFCKSYAEDEMELAERFRQRYIRAYWKRSELIKSMEKSA